MFCTEQPPPPQISELCWERKKGLFQPYNLPRVLPSLEFLSCLRLKVAVHQMFRKLLSIFVYKGRQEEEHCIMNQYTSSCHWLADKRDQAPSPCWDCLPIYTARWIRTRLGSSNSNVSSWILWKFFLNPEFCQSANFQFYSTPTYNLTLHFRICIMKKTNDIICSTCECFNTSFLDNTPNISLLIVPQQPLAQSMPSYLPFIHTCQH